MQPIPIKKDTEKRFDKKVWATAGVISLVVVVLLLFKALFNIMLLVLAGVLMAIYFLGCANLLNKYLHLPSKLAVVFSVLLNLVLVVGFLWFVGARLQQQISQLSDTLPSTIDNAKHWMKQYPGGDKVLNYLNSSGDSSKTISIVKRFFSSSFGILSDGYIILLMGLFFTASPLIYKHGVIKILPSSAKNKGEEVLQGIHKLLKNWIKGQLFGFMFIGGLTGIGLWIIGMPLILTLALVAGLMNFIPNFGPLIALVPAVLLALMQGTTTALIVVGIYTGIQIIQTAVTQPLIQQKMVSVPPALLIFGQVAMGLLGGFWGVLLATPVLVILMTLIDKLYIQKQNYQKYNSQESE